MLSQIRWGAAVVGAVVAEVAQIAAAFGWVAVYSYFINPGQPVETYQAYAQAAVPWVAVVAGAPIFYAASRRFAGSVPMAMALFALFLIADGSVLVMSGGPYTGLLLFQAAASYVTKFPACWLGGLHATTRTGARLTIGSVPH